MLIRIAKGWEIPEREVTPEDVYLRRREFLAGAGLLGTAGLLSAQAPASVYAAKRNPAYTVDRPITEEFASTGYNNFYEFTEEKTRVKDLVGNYKTTPWTLEISGLCNKPQKINLDDIEKSMTMEERVYRFRCVETWAMTVPWTGFPLSELIKKADPKPEAKFVRFISVQREAEMPGIRQASYYPWPYYEGLRMDEAMNPLALMVIGMYGKSLPKQNGAPLRLIVPWKYGYKSAKAIVKMEFVAKQPGTFWQKLNAQEYGFYSNVDPKKPHPRWSQAIEKIIPNMERKPTLAYNGYGQWVQGLYNGQET